MFWKLMGFCFSLGLAMIFFHLLCPNPVRVLHCLWWFFPQICGDLICETPWRLSPLVKTCLIGSWVEFRRNGAILAFPIALHFFRKISAWGNWMATYITLVYVTIIWIEMSLAVQVFSHVYVPFAVSISIKTSQECHLTRCTLRPYKKGCP